MARIEGGTTEVDVPKMWGHSNRDGTCLRPLRSAVRSSTIGCNAQGAPRKAHLASPAQALGGPRLEVASRCSRRGDRVRGGATRVVCDRPARIRSAIRWTGRRVGNRGRHRPSADAQVVDRCAGRRACGHAAREYCCVVPRSGPRRSATRRTPDRRRHACPRHHDTPPRRDHTEFGA